MVRIFFFLDFVLERGEFFRQQDIVYPQQRPQIGIARPEALARLLKTVLAPLVEPGVSI